jgi:hypothetical protein
MQRLTWSGIALHGGVLPGYPASHGCIRMPYDFAARLFDATELGLRVFVSPRDVAPVDIAHPVLFQPKPGAGALAAARIAEADEATRNANQARRAAGAAFRDVAQAMVPVRAAANLKLRAEAQLTAAEAALGAASSDEAKRQAEEAKAQATARIAELQAQWDAANAELQPKLDAANQAREAATAAESARAAAAKAAREAARELEPVSVFISRKTQKLYVRRGFEPVLESPVTIRDPDKPIGTHVFTAVGRTDSGLRWTVVSLNEASDAKSALDRIVIPQDVLDRIAPTASPRSSLIISDEPLSRETGKGTDFIAVLSDQPQGGLAMRHHPAPAEPRYARQRERQPAEPRDARERERQYGWGSSNGWSSSAGWGSWGGSYGAPYGRW